MAIFAMMMWALALTPAEATRAEVRAAGQPAAVLVVFETENGRIDIEVDAAHAPVTSANFLRYVDSGAYNGAEFHRAVRPTTEIRKDYPIQVIQARRAAGTPGFPAIRLERTRVTGLSHKDATVSMARDGADTATSDFFICIGDQPELDFGGRRNGDGQGFAAFGRVVAGMDVVKAIQGSPVAPNSQTLAPPVRIARAFRIRNSV